MFELGLQRHLGGIVWMGMFSLVGDCGSHTLLDDCWDSVRTPVFQAGTSCFVPFRSETCASRSLDELYRSGFQLSLAPIRFDHRARAFPVRPLVLYIDYRYSVRSPTLQVRRNGPLPVRGRHNGFNCPSSSSRLDSVGGSTTASVAHGICRF